MKKGDSFKDNILNTWYLIKNFIRKNIFKQKGKYMIPNNYNLIFEDNFKVLKDDIWMTTQYFGEINTGYPWQYCTPNAVKFTDDGLKLYQYYNERTIEYWDGNTYDTLFDVGCLTSKIPFTYGIYEFNVVFPHGKWLWPAVWFTGYDTYPPEFDLIEGYSNEKGKYKSALNTNAHYGLNDVRTEIRARKTLYFNENELQSELNFKLVWERNKLDFYVNNFKVRTLTNKEIFKWFNDKKVRIVLNNAVRENYFNKIPIEQQSVFTVKNMKYYKQN